MGTYLCERECKRISDLPEYSGYDDPQEGWGWEKGGGVRFNLNRPIIYTVFRF